jgi:ubiquinone/menaquinone biosynthesis C-methylase UbiE
MSKEKNQMGNIDRKKLVREYYSRRSKDYDRQKSRTWKSSQGFGNGVLDELLRALTGSWNGLLLEVGVGSGRNALPLLEKVKPQVVGLDLSREMLNQAKTKMSSFKDCLDLILADGEHLPFVNRAFDALICVSTMHYFESQGRILVRFRDVVKEHGTLVYGDLTVHEADNQQFFEGLEKTLSRAHAGYHKPSQIKRLMEKQGFHALNMKTTEYQKPYSALIEDKGQYFGVTRETLQAYINGASAEAKKQYALTSTGMTLHYTVITAKKKAEKT